jgi:O-antigen ligase
MGIVLLILFLVSRETRPKRIIRKAATVGVPFAIVYVVLGWSSQYGRLFKPVRIIRSVVEANSDTSSQWREIENFDLVSTFNEHLFFGTGYGTGFTEFVTLPAVDYFLERYLPHNSFLGLWSSSGTLGVFGITTLWVAGLYYAMRAYHAAQSPPQYMAAISCFAALPIYLAQCFGDLGLNSWTGVFMVAVSVAMSGKLAVAAGQWPGGGLLTKQRS